MRGVFLDYATVSQDDIDLSPLRDGLDELEVHAVTPQADIVARIAGFEVVLTNKCQLTADIICQSLDLKIICLAATGFNNVDIAAAREHGVAVCNIRAYCTGSVTQHVFAMALALTQHLQPYQALLQQGAWKQAPQFTLLDYPIHELSGRTFGIIGYGTLGQSVENVARAFGMKVLIAERKGQPPRAGRVPFETVMSDSDIISVHCPLTDETRKLIDANSIALMKPTAILVNTARGAVVDEQALANALCERRIGGAGIDVLSEEPPVNGNPLLDIQSPQLIMTPHVAWAAVEARQRAIEQMAAAVRAFAAGERFNRVD